MCRCKYVMTLNINVTSQLLHPSGIKPLSVFHNSIIWVLAMFCLRKTWSFEEFTPSPTNCNLKSTKKFTEVLEYQSEYLVRLLWNLCCANNLSSPVLSKSLPLFIGYFSNLIEPPNWFEPMDMLAHLILM